MNKNKVSKQFWGGVTDFLGGSPPQNGPAGNPAAWRKFAKSRVFQWILMRQQRFYLRVLFLSL